MTVVTVREHPRQSAYPDTRPRKRRTICRFCRRETSHVIMHNGWLKCQGCEAYWNPEKSDAPGGWVVLSSGPDERGKACLSCTLPDCDPLNPKCPLYEGGDDADD